MDATADHSLQRHYSQAIMMASLVIVIISDLHNDSTSWIEDSTSAVLNGLDFFINHLNSVDLGLLLYLQILERMKKKITHIRSNQPINKSERNYL